MGTGKSLGSAQGHAVLGVKIWKSNCSSNVWQELESGKPLRGLLCGSRLRGNGALNWSSGNGNGEGKTKIPWMIDPFNNPVQIEQVPVLTAS